MLGWGAELVSPLFHKEDQLDRNCELNFCPQMGICIDCGLINQHFSGCCGSHASDDPMLIVPDLVGQIHCVETSSLVGP